MKSIYSIVGMKFHNAEKFLGSQRAGEYLRLIREPDNPHDPFAIKVLVGERTVGYVKATEAKLLANEMDSYHQTEIPARLAFAGRYPHAEVG
jgi:HIRAN domain